MARHSAAAASIVTGRRYGGGLGLGFRLGVSAWGSVECEILWGTVVLFLSSLQHWYPSYQITYQTVNSRQCVCFSVVVGVASAAVASVGAFVVLLLILLLLFIAVAVRAAEKRKKKCGVVHVHAIAHVVAAAAVTVVLHLQSVI